VDLTIFLLVLLSASLLHALWNSLVKRSSNPTLFLGMSKLSESIIFLGPFIYFYDKASFDLANLGRIIVATLLVFLNYLLLAQAYKRIDMSLVYPVSRSSTLFLPGLAYFFFDETINSFELIALVSITLGVFTIQFHSFKLSEWQRFVYSMLKPGMLFGFAAAFVLALYTLWDKAAIQNIQPFLYFYSYTVLTAAIFALMMLKRYPFTQMTKFFGCYKKSIIIVALANTTGYLLLLFALSQSKVTDVGALRQFSLVVGLILGWRFLQERMTLPKIVGTLLIVLGSVAILFSV